ncbi:MAG TPA: hypothetical protein VGK74_09995 [Symbiobacteriaceae bacterium]|jgi:hypothetical protein
MLFAALCFVIAAAILAAVVAVRGALIPPEGNLVKPITGMMAMSFILVSAAAFLPLAGYSHAARLTWRWVMVLCAMYAMVFEPLQHFRGLDPRVSFHDGPVDLVFRWIYFVTSQAYVALFAALAWRFFQGSTSDRRPLLTLGIRYGLVSVCGLAFTAGYWMLSNWWFADHERYVGASGDVIWLHAFGFHGLQCLPLIAWLFEQTTLPAATARRWVHIGGISWLAAGAMIAWQTALGWSVTELSPISAVGAALFLVWACVLGKASVHWFQQFRFVQAGDHRQGRSQA